MPAVWELKPAKSAGPTPPPSYSWNRLKIGAGGFVTGISIADDGTKVVRTDTYGAYIWDGDLDEWRSLVTKDTMPSPEFDGGLAGRTGGVYSIAIAPSDSDRIYLCFVGYIYKSDDKGYTFTRTSLSIQTADANDGVRAWGGKMAVDPINPEVVYAGTQSGFYVTYNGGTSWSSVPTVPSSSTGIMGIAFDRSSGTTDGKTNTVWAASNDNGVYRTTNAGSSWAAVSGGSTACSNGACAIDGVYYLCTGSNPDGLRKSSGGAWTNIHPPGDGNYMQSIACDPFNSARIAAGNDGGGLNYSTDRGSTWTSCSSRTRSATGDVTWLGWAEENYMSSGMQAFDPVTQNLLWFAQGIGVWRTDTTGNPVATPWVSQSRGIEGLSPNQICKPLGGNIMLGSWDRPIFKRGPTQLDTYAADYYPPTEGGFLYHCWAIDYATEDPNFLVAIITATGGNQSACSTDKGVTWSSFADLPAGSPYAGGSMAVNAKDNIIWVPSYGRQPYYSTNRGASWTLISLPGISDYTALHPMPYLARHVVAADRVTAGVFYMFCPYPYANEADSRVFKTTNGGANWTEVFHGTILPQVQYWNVKLRSVPGKAGHLFYCSGPQGGGGTPNHFLKHSTDGGVTWTAPNTHLTEITSFGFGKSATVGGYPAIFASGWYDGVNGVYQSDDEGVTWTRLGESYPLGILTGAGYVEGDLDVYGRCYATLAGDGWAYYG